MADAEEEGEVVRGSEERRPPTASSGQLEGDSYYRGGRGRGAPIMRGSSRGRGGMVIRGGRGSYGRGGSVPGRSRSPRAVSMSGSAVSYNRGSGRSRSPPPGRPVHLQRGPAPPPRKRSASPPPHQPPASSGIPNSNPSSTRMNRPSQQSRPRSPPPNTKPIVPPPAQPPSRMSPRLAPLQGSSSTSQPLHPPLPKPRGRSPPPPQVRSTANNIASQPNPSSSNVSTTYPPQLQQSGGRGLGGPSYRGGRVSSFPNDGDRRRSRDRPSHHQPTTYASKDTNEDMQFQRRASDDPHRRPYYMDDNRHAKQYDDRPPVASIRPPPDYRRRSRESIPSGRREYIHHREEDIARGRQDVTGRFGAGYETKPPGWHNDGTSRLPPPMQQQTNPPDHVEAKDEVTRGSTSSTSFRTFSNRNPRSAERPRFNDIREFDDRTSLPTNRPRLSSSSKPEDPFDSHRDKRGRFEDDERRVANRMDESEKRRFDDIERGRSSRFDESKDRRSRFDDMDRRKLDGDDTVETPRRPLPLGNPPKQSDMQDSRLRPSYPSDTYDNRLKPSYPPHNTLDPRAKPTYHSDFQDPRSKPSSSIDTQDPRSKMSHTPNVQEPRSQPSYPSSSQEPRSQPGYPSSSQEPRSQSGYPSSSQDPRSKIGSYTSDNQDLRPRPSYPQNIQDSRPKPNYPQDAHDSRSKPSYPPDAQDPRLKPSYPSTNIHQPSTFPNRPPVPSTYSERYRSSTQPPHRRGRSHSPPPPPPPQYPASSRPVHPTQVPTASGYPPRARRSRSRPRSATTKTTPSFNLTNPELRRPPSVPQYMPQRPQSVGLSQPPVQAVPRVPSAAVTTMGIGEPNKDAVATATLQASTVDASKASGPTEEPPRVRATPDKEPPIPPITVLNEKALILCENDDLRLCEKLRQDLEVIRFAQFSASLKTAEAELTRAWAQYELRQADERLSFIQTARYRSSNLF